MPNNYFARYLPLLFQMLVAGGLATIMVVLSFVLGKHKYSKQKMSPYECGMDPIGDARGRFWCCRPARSISPSACFSSRWCPPVTGWRNA